MHTPDQARELWCPMVRTARHEVAEQRQMVNAKTGMELVNEHHHVVGGCNTDALGSLRVPASCTCIADQCAMWRWVPRYEQCDAPHGRKVDGEPIEPTHGYCGMAGRPV